ncbi:MAG: hypothetical protein JXR97_11400 [Planctomycetes bacterium]|nr:hypothetical protein [Planctomycetota bacterium]
MNFNNIEYANILYQLSVKEWEHLYNTDFRLLKQCGCTNNKNAIYVIDRLNSAKEKEVFSKALAKRWQNPAFLKTWGEEATPAEMQMIQAYERKVGYIKYNEDDCSVEKDKKALRKTQRESLKRIIGNSLGRICESSTNSWCYMFEKNGIVILTDIDIGGSFLSLRYRHYVRAIGEDGKQVIQNPLAENTSFLSLLGLIAETSWEIRDHKDADFRSKMLLALANRFIRSYFDLYSHSTLCKKRTISGN